MRFRKERVASAVRDIVSEAIAHRLNDPRVAPMTTVTRVEMTGDLLVAKVYLSVPGDESAEGRTLAAVLHAGGFIRRIVARELSIRQCPELRFAIDEAAKGVRRTMALLDENRRTHPALFPPEPDGDASRGEDGADEDGSDGAGAGAD